MDAARESVRRDLITLGDAKCQNKAEQVSKIKMAAGRVKDQLGMLQDIVCATVLECVLKLPTKTHIYATYVGVLNNVGHRTLVKMLMDKLIFTLQVSTFLLQSVSVRKVARAEPHIHCDHKKLIDLSLIHI